MKPEDAIALAVELLLDDLLGNYFYLDRLSLAQEYCEMLNILSGREFHVVQYFIEDEMRFCIREKKGAEE